MNEVQRKERAHTILGVSGRMFNAIADGAGLFVSQTWGASRTDGKQSVSVDMRFDDQCKNGHQTFSITGTIYEMVKGRKVDVACGCIHDDITRVFPELAPLIKWHLVSTDYPMHYVANTVYHASDRDHWGLRKGETKQVLKGGKVPSWRLTAVDDNGDEITGEKLPQYAEGETQPAGRYHMEYRPWLHYGEGKARELNHARSSAVWPDATDEQLTAEPEALTAALLARLPQVMAEFRAAMVDACGFEWREVAKGGR